MEFPSGDKIRQAALATLLSVAIAAGVVTCAGAAETPHNTEPIAGAELEAGPVNLLSTQSHWQLAGVNDVGGKLIVSNTNLGIVHQDGSAGEIDVPVNQYGTVMENHGGFKLTADLSGIKGDVEVDMDGEPPLMQDEFLAHQDNLSVKITGGKTFNATVNDQKHGNNAASLNAAITPNSIQNLTVTDAAGKLTFSSNGHSIGKPISDDGIFGTGRVYFGFDALTNNGSFTVNKLITQGQSGGTVGLTDTRNESITISPSGFAAMADKIRPGFIVGTATQLGPLVSDTKYDSIMGNFNSITPEDDGKNQVIEPKPGVFNFANLDALHAIAKKAGMKFHDHTQIFAEANPVWLTNLAKTHPSELPGAMKTIIDTEFKRYPDDASTDIIDEPLADYGQPADAMGLRKDIWTDALGPAALVDAIKDARAADPNIELDINDFGMESDPNRFQQMLNLLSWLKSQGAPIDGIGFEAHIDDGDTNASDTDISIPMLESRFAALGTLGVKAEISELDISNTPQEYRVFADAITACIKSPDCTRVTLWGPTDKYGSGANITTRGLFEPSVGRPFDVNENPTPAVTYIKNALIALGG